MASASSPPLPAASSSPPTSPVISNTPVSPVIPLQEQQTSQSVPPNQDNSIVLPPPPVAQTTEPKPAPSSSPIASVAPKNVDSCCSSTVAIGFLALGLIMFLIFVTIAGQLGQSSTAFCEGYVSLLHLVEFFLSSRICSIGSGAHSRSTSSQGMYVRARFVSTSSCKN
jgi:hypothetical protein